MLSDLPRDLAEEVLSRFPVTSLRGVRRTCKKWNTLSKDRSFTRRHISKEEVKKKQRKEFQVVMMLDYKVYLFSVNLLYPNNCIERVGQLISLDDADQVDISNIFHCDGLLLCIAKDISRLVVWNPCSGQTRWLQPRTSFTRWDSYALGYEMKNNAYSHKVLRFVDIYENCMSPQLCEFEIYNFNSNSWKVLDVNPDWDIEYFRRGLSLHGNAYWFSQDKKIWEADPPFFLLCFDFTTERFGPRLPVPFHPYPRDTVVLSSVRENQLAVLHHRVSTRTLKIWITTKIEPNAVSWNELFLKVEMKPLTDFIFCLYAGTFFVDERKKVAVVLDKNRTRPKYTRNIAYIIGEKGYFEKVDLGESVDVLVLSRNLPITICPSLEPVLAATELRARFEKKSGKNRVKKLKSKKAEAEEHEEQIKKSVQEMNSDDIAMDQKSYIKRGKKVKSKKAEAEEHEEQRKRLQETQADFHQYMKEHDAEHLKFDATEIEVKFDATEIEDDSDVEPDTDSEDTEKQGDDETPKLEIAKKANEPKTITSAMVKSWCNSIREDAKSGAVGSILRAYRTACHYGDDTGDDQSIDKV